MLKCGSCELRGYCKDLCHMHQKHLKRTCPETALTECGKQPSLDGKVKLGMAATTGFGIGVLTLSAGLALVPAIGATMLGHVLAIKVAKLASNFGNSRNEKAKQ